MGDEFRINVNFPVLGASRVAAEALNTRLRDLEDATNEVAFGPDGNSQPHLTIVLGDIRAGGLTELVDRVGYWAETLTRFTVSFGPAYREIETGCYVMADARIPDRFNNRRRELRGSVSHLFTDVGRMTSTPHLTLGYFETEWGTVDRTVRRIPPIPDANIGSVAVTRSGQRGISGPVLAAFTLDQPPA